MRKTLSLMALLGTGIATCLFAASPVFGDEPGSRAGEKPQSADVHHPDMVFSTDVRKGSAAGDKRQRIPKKTAKSASEGLGLRGSAMFMSSWGDNENHYGIYNIPYTQGMQFSPVFTSTAAIGCGYDNGDGLFYGFARVIEGGETEVADLTPYTSKAVRFRQTMTPAQGDEAVFTAEAVLDNDENKGNNRTGSVTVHRRTSLLPTVSGFTGERKGNEDNLKWNAYNPDDYETSEITEDFESGEPFGRNFNGWTFVDMDGMPVGGFGNYSIPGIEIGTTTASFFVFDTAAGTYSDSFKAHSGTKYLASLYRHDFGELNDWLISPELPGSEQEISFWAKSYDPSTPEKIQLWYSTKSNDIEDFVRDLEFGTVELRSYDWQKFTATLPEGTRYFAIRSMAEDSFMLMIDDITCTRVPMATGELLGYNIYCNNEKINPATVTANAFTTPHNGLDLTYCVSALFENGESELSAPVMLSSSGLFGNLADGAKVSVLGRIIQVQGAGDKAVAVSTVDGMTVYRGTGDAAIPVSPAVYIVTVGGNAVKVAVQ